MAEIGLLMCGAPSDEGSAKTALKQLTDSVNFFGNRLLGLVRPPATEELRAQTIEDLTRFAPFCARVVLENSCAALMGRFDPFRMMYLCEFQSQPEYETGRRAKSSFAWTGDVLPGDEKVAQTLWNIDYDVPKIGRALLSRHFDHVYWKPAVDRMLDFISNAPRNALLGDILQLESGTFINSIRGRAAQLHSALSKGVHWEFFNSVLISDEVTVRTSIKDTINLVADLGLVSHFVPTSYATLPAANALDLYIEIRGEFNDH